MHDHTRSAHFLKILFLTLFFIPFFVSAATPTVSIQSISPGTTIYSGNAVYFTAVPSDFNGSTSFSVSDSVSSTVSSSNINSGGVFVWVPSSSEAGTHTITVTVTDGAGNSASSSLQITVIGPATATIQGLNPGPSVNVGQTVFWSTATYGLINPTFSVGDSMVSSLTSNSINSSGGFSWTPKQQDIGNHTITITASDSAGRSASVNQSISVSIATATIQSLVPGDSVIARQNVSFSVSPSGFSNPVYSVTDSVYGSSVNSSNMSSSGNFSWTPGTNDIGTHLITIHISDSTGNSMDLIQPINVGSATMTLGSITPGTSIKAGTPLYFTASTTGFTNPSFLVSDSFSGGTLSSGNMSSSGIFTWTPSGIDAGSHYITITAIDNSGNRSSNSITINVSPANSTPTLPPTAAPQATAATSGFVFTSFLTIGSSGPEVTELQKMLAANGYFSGSATGYFGALTAAAVRRFQSANGISPLGYVGPGTRAMLNSGSSSAPTQAASARFTFTRALSIGSSGSEVTELQNKLASLGLYSGPITGTFGPLTQAAVKKFQAKYGLEQVGNVGPGTRSALNNLQ